MTHRALIAIVDDDRCLREKLEDLVRSLGYTAASFASADQYISSGVVDDTVCLIADLQMPDMTGADLQDRLIAHGLDTPIIFVTANRDDSVGARTRDAGAPGLLCKPFDEQWLRGHIAEALRCAPHGKPPVAGETAVRAAIGESQRVERKRGRWPPVARSGERV